MQCFFQFFMLWTPCFTLILPKIMKQRRLHRNDLLQETDLIISCDAPPGLACQYIIIFIKQSINGICSVFQIFMLWTPCFTLILPKKWNNAHYSETTCCKKLISSYCVTHHPYSNVDTSSFSLNRLLTGYAVFFTFLCCKNHVLRSFYQK